jgi:hypothetical protein
LDEIFGFCGLPLHYGYVPDWLAEGMAKLGLAVTESIIAEYGKHEMLRRLSDRFDDFAPYSEKKVGKQIPEVSAQIGLIKKKMRFAKCIFPDPSKKFILL